MFVDIWVVLIIAACFGFCAVWNYNAGLRKGIEATLSLLEHEKIIMVDGETVVPYKNTTTS